MAAVEEARTRLRAQVANVETMLDLAHTMVSGWSDALQSRVVLVDCDLSAGSVSIELEDARRKKAIGWENRHKDSSWCANVRISCGLGVVRRSGILCFVPCYAEFIKYLTFGLATRHFPLSVDMKEIEQHLMEEFVKNLNE
jgi:hypothetical protein